MREYKLISGDSHINEPPDLWADRVPAKFKDQAPRMVSLEQGSAWIMEGAADPINFGLNACGGLGEEHYVPWVKWEDVRQGGYLPGPRLLLQDEGGVDAEVLYPSPRIGNNVFTTREDPEYHLAMIRGYNDWMAELCGHDPERLIGLALMPTIGVDTAVAEMQRIAKLPGMKGVLLGKFPNGSLAITPEDDPFWAAAQDANIPVNIHVGLATDPPPGVRVANHPAPFFGAFTGALRFADVSIRAQDLIYNKVFDRFPKLMIVFAEVDCAWVPYVKEQLDDRYSRQNRADRPEFKLCPSEYFERNLFYTIVADALGVRYRHDTGVDQIMWSSDFPHGTCVWPNAWEIIDSEFQGVPDDEKHKILAGNAARVYNLS